jgi:hypothetical protein
LKTKRKLVAQLEEERRKQAQVEALHPVAIGESWVSLAATVGWSPWDLIRYSYPTLPADLQLASKEVICIPL